MQGTLLVVGLLGGLLVGQVLLFRYLNGTLPALGHAGSRDVSTAGGSERETAESGSRTGAAVPTAEETVKCRQCGTVNGAEQSFVRCRECLSRIS